ncbi:uncharacterized protein LOC128740230 [Sabethes cyaneus]|uniref:uncharacterized protein LOC128740230 n=1 Tax=Sabethes cyaneus TaxID=53552 RepID=UPI00237DC0EA|nr:uncharacterized protein LOC128740230 [Sabethes cyaneus]
MMRKLRSCSRTWYEPPPHTSSCSRINSEVATAHLASTSHHYDESEVYHEATPVVVKLRDPGNNRNSNGSDANRILNRLSTSSSLSIITPPTTPKRPAAVRLKMSLSLSLAHNFNQKLANLNDKWNDFSFMLKHNPVKALPARNDSYHSIESAVTCTAADLEAANLSGGACGFDEREYDRRKLQQGGISGLAASNSGKSNQQKSFERRHRQRLSPRRNSAGGDPKEFDVLVMKPMDSWDDNESF